MKKAVILFCVILPVSAFYCFAEGLDTLIQLGKSQAEIQEQYLKETKTFETVRNAIASGDIKEGQDKASIRAKYGEPVVVVNDLDGKRESWIYKPADSSFFKGVRAALVFTADGILDEVKLEER